MQNFPLRFLLRIALLAAGFFLGSPVAARAQMAPLAGAVPAAKPLYGNYDIRGVSVSAAPVSTATASRTAYRRQQVTTAKATALAALPRTVASARAALAVSVPTLHTEANRFGLAAPEIVGTSSVQLLTAASARPREETLRAFLGGNAALYGLSATETAGLVKFADYINPAGDMAWVGLRQELNGIPVFQSEIMAGFSAKGALARTTGNLAVGLEASSLPSAAVLTPAQAVSAASATVGRTVDAAKLTAMAVPENSRSATLVGGPYSSATKTELIYFPLEPGVATLAYAMTLWDQPAYYVIVDANDGTLLWRKNITNDQSQSVTYNVYTGDSPSPLSPTNVLPGQGTQPAGVGRTSVSLISDDATASPLGWITDSAAGATITTTGNNCDAGLDAASPDGIDVSTSTNTYISRPTTTNRTFSFSYNPPPLGTDAVTSYTSATSGSVTTNTITAYASGAVTNLFFWTNRYHDALYKLGFTEAARNFQATNTFNGTDRGGVAGDAVSAQVHDYGGTNNANFSTPADGSPGRMQMYIFTAPTPGRDGSLDGDVYLHEMTHGVSNRLHNNGSGLVSTQSGGMGEGWSDFYARCLLSSADEDVDGVYAAGAYVTYLYGNSTSNYYYGIRRFPYAVISKLGANGKPHNPETFADIDLAKIDLSNGAYPSNPIFNSPGNAIEVHNTGEIWCSMLLEVRERMIKRLGYADTQDGNGVITQYGGNTLAMQLVTNGMKLDPVAPTILQARDAIIAADNVAAKAGAFGGAEVLDIRAGFAARGAGAGAVDTGGYIVESYLPDIGLGNVTFSDTPGNGNGFPEPGEDLLISVPLTNVMPTAETATATIGSYTASYSLAANGGSGTQVIPYRVPASATAGSTIQVPIVFAGQYGPETRNFPLTIGVPIYAQTTNAPIHAFSESFDGVAVPALPSDWMTSVTTGTAVTPVAWKTVASPTVDAGNSVFSPDVAGTNASGTGGEADLISPAVTVPSGSGQKLIFKHTYDFETYLGSYLLDGGVLEIKIGTGAFTDIVTAGGSFVQGGYTGTIYSGTGTADYKNPLKGRSGWVYSVGTSPNTVIVNLPASAAGQSVQFRWRLGVDLNYASVAVGWNIDSVQVVTGYTVAAIDSDGDGLQDGYETAHGLNPNDATDAAKDSDGDGVSNLQEYLAGTDPQDANSLLRIAQETYSATAGTSVSFPSVNGKGYALDYKNDLTDPTWTLVTGATVNGTGGIVSLTDTTNGGLTKRFYRVRVSVP